MVKSKPLIYLIASLFGVLQVIAAELPEDEIQMNMNGYFDNFGVKIVYPDLSVRKSISATTSINGRYLIDIITAASTRSQFNNVYSYQNVESGIDAFTSATRKDTALGHGGGDDFPDETRHEVAFGITQLIGETTVSINNIFSTENDYDSKTIAASVSIPFAKKNTIVNAGIVKSWDRSFPQTRAWTAGKDVLSLSLGMSQIFSVKFLAQAEVFYSNMSGFLPDPYQVVTVANFDSNSLAYFEPRYPDDRKRYAAGMRGIYKTGEPSSLQLGYRYYGDSWDINSHTLSGLFQYSFYEDDLILGLGIRYYTQAAASFFKENYTAEEEYMAVDPKLKEMYSSEFQLNATINGGIIPLINNEDIKLSTRVHFFHRYTDAPDWHSRNTDLRAFIFSLGFRYLY